jgi:septal ring factor EnvC (AmiA/AmiB activator)
MITKLEQELAAHKSEVTTVRNRLIKAEGGLEREKKAVERLENKLAATANIR